MPKITPLLTAGENYFLVGVKGVAMVALAECLIDAGKTVSGTDVAEEFVTQDQLNKLIAQKKIVVKTGFEIEVLPDEVDNVIYSGAHQGIHNPVVQAAIKKGISVWSHAQALAGLFNFNRGWAVSGTNGKSTTTAMLAYALEKLGAQPNYAIGVGSVVGLDKVGHYQTEEIIGEDSERIFVAEADEYAEDSTQVDHQLGLQWARMSYLKSQTVVITNLSYDHPDVYQNLAHVQRIFIEWLEKIKPEGNLIINGDQESLKKVMIACRELRPDVKVVTFGRDEKNDFSLAKIDFNLQIMGEHNQENALAALAALVTNGFDQKRSIEVLNSFRGLKRRLEFLGEVKGAKYYDDYAHHPDEIRATLGSLRRVYPDQKIIAIFQSHTFSRTRELFSGFVESLLLADQVLLLDIYPSAREAYDPQTNADQMVAALNQAKKRSDFAQNLHDVQKVADYCRREVKNHDIVLNMGAGDSYHFFDWL